jgi:hypothetical protein
MLEDNSMEFDMLEEARRNLTEVLVRKGHDSIEAERIALYVIQGVRELPKFLRALIKGTATDTEILDALHAVLDNAASLYKARSILLGLDDQTVH